jgi:hypothetical protein
MKNNLSLFNYVCNTFWVDDQTGWVYDKLTDKRCYLPYRKRNTMLFKGNLVPCARVVWALSHGYWPPETARIVHINKDSCDDRAENLLRVDTKLHASDKVIKSQLKTLSEKRKTQCLRAPKRTFGTR